MAYEKLELHVTGINNQIVLGQVKKDGMLSDNRKNMTNNAILAVATYLSELPNNGVKIGNKGTLKWIPNENNSEN